jgi:hypothetical protein
MTNSQHTTLHKIGNTNCKGRRQSKDTGIKISLSLIGIKRGPLLLRNRHAHKNLFGYHKVVDMFQGL